MMFKVLKEMRFSYYNRKMKMNDAPALKYWRHGFDDPTLGSPQTFREIFAAMEHPGRLVTIGENPNAPDVLNLPPPA